MEDLLILHNSLRKGKGVARVDMNEISVVYFDVDGELMLTLKCGRCLTLVTTVKNKEILDKYGLFPSPLEEVIKLHE